MTPRILCVIDQTEAGGAQSFLYQILSALRDKFSFGVAVLGKSGPYTERYAALGIPVFSLGDRRGRWNPLSIIDLIHLIRRDRYELVHSYLFKSAVLATIAAKWTNRKVIVHDQSGIYPSALGYRIHNGVLRKFYLLAFRFAVTRCDRIVALTEEMRQTYKQYYPIDLNKVVVIPNAVNVDLIRQAAIEGRTRSIRSELSLPPDAKLIIMVGRLEPVKGWLTFLVVAQRFQSVSDLRSEFLAVGSGSEEQMLHDRARGIERLHFLGNRDDVYRLLGQADVFVLTSRDEAFPLALLESMAASCPVVSTRTTGPASIIADRDNGLLADVGDVDGLTRAIDRLLHDDGLREKITIQARQTVARHYDIGAVSDRIARLYASVLEQ